jgi:hypothetical protein
MEVIAEAGDCEERNFDRNRRRYLRGIGFGIEGHANGNLAFVYVVGELAV